MKVEDKPKIVEASDKPIPDLIDHAQHAIKSWQDNSGMTPRVMFKHTCGLCGQRGFVEKPNTVPKVVECENCGGTQPYDRGGYSLAFELAGTSPHGYTANDKRKVVFARPDAAMVRKAAPSAKGLPTRTGCRMNPDQTVTPIDKEALLQFVATLQNQDRPRSILFTLAAQGQRTARTSVTQGNVGSTRAMP